MIIKVLRRTFISSLRSSCSSHNAHVVGLLRQHLAGTRLPAGYCTGIIYSRATSAATLCFCFVFSRHAASARFLFFFSLNFKEEAVDSSSLSDVIRQKENFRLNGNSNFPVLLNFSFVIFFNGRCRSLHLPERAVRKRRRTRPSLLAMLCDVAASVRR